MKDFEVDEKIIHCEQCKYWGTKTVPGETDYVKCCELAGYMIGANGFCLYGKERNAE